MIEYLDKAKMVRVGYGDYNPSPVSGFLVSPLSALSFKVRSIKCYKISQFTESDESCRSVNVSSLDVELFNNEIHPRLNFVLKGKFNRNSFNNFID